MIYVVELRGLQLLSLKTDKLITNVDIAATGNKLCRLKLDSVQKLFQSFVLFILFLLKATIQVRLDLLFNTFGYGLKTYSPMRTA